YDSITQSVSLGLLGPLADVVPTGVIAFDVGSGNTNQVTFNFNVRPAPGPSVILASTAGSPLEMDILSGTLFTPDSRVTILIDNPRIGSTKTDSTGSFSELFQIPSLPDGDYFVTATDDKGKFDFSVLSIP